MVLFGWIQLHFSGPGAVDCTASAATLSVSFLSVFVCHGVTRWLSIDAEAEEKCDR